MNDLPVALRPEQAARYLSLSVQRLARLRLDGTGPVYSRAGRSVLYLRQDLDSWLHANRRRSTSDSGIKGGRPVRFAQPSERSSIKGPCEGDDP
jgi:hypothetical protein